MGVGEHSALQPRILHRRTLPWPLPDAENGRTERFTGRKSVDTIIRASTMTPFIKSG
jgi:hypothetical protein